MLRASPAGEVDNADGVVEAITLANVEPEVEILWALGVRIVVLDPALFVSIIVGFPMINQQG